MIRKSIVIAATLAAVVLSGGSAFAQTGLVAGTVMDPKGPVAGVMVTLEGPSDSRQTVTDPKGTFSLSGVAPGSYHLVVRADGYVPTRVELAVSASTPPLEVRLNPDPHFSEVISVSPDARSLFDSYQPTSVLGGQDLAQKLRSSLGATLAEEPGVAVRGFGPGPARPVIRGLDGDRVLVLQDGNRMGDLSSQSGDHGVNVNPAAARKIEVVRGPATLLYGANAIGGLVNVITSNIPAAPVATPTGSVTFDLGSASKEGGAAGEVNAGRGPVAVHFSASGRRAADYTSPDGIVPNSFSRSRAVEGGLSFVGENGYAGASVGYDRSEYGIPFVEEGETNLNPRRKTFDFRAERRNLGGPFSSIRASAGIRRYTHNELDGEEIATTFLNNTTEVALLANHRPAGKLKGTIGAQFLTRAFSAEGEESLSPPVDQNGGSFLLYEEATVSQHVTLQFGGRVDHTSFSPSEDFAARSFNTFSGSLGLLAHPTEQTTIAFSLARASRNPALEELYFHGPHPGNAAIENGDDSLASERATGFDATLRWHGARASGELTYFFNSIRDFVFRELSGEIDEDLPVTFFTQADATLSGVEAHLDLRVAPAVWLEAGVDYVRGELADLDRPLPRIPPLRGRVGVKFQHNALQAGVDGMFVAKQDRIFTLEGPDGLIGETATDGYSLARAFAAWSVSAGRTTHTLAVRLENVTNANYHNHLNYLKDLVPELGRDFRVTYTAAF